MKSKQRIIYLLAGPVIFAVITLLLSNLLTTPGAEVVGLLLWMIFWWVTRPVNMTVTALMPIVVNAIFNIIPMETVTGTYFSDSIILIFGSCLLTIPWKSSGLDKRVALKILSIVGPTMKSQITVWLLASMIFSSVIPNVAVVALFTPIAISMLAAAGHKDITKSEPAVPILLAICWGAGLGGVGTPLGGAMNVAAISYLEEFTGKEFMYIDWIIHIIPFFIISAVVMLISMLFMNKGTRPLDGTKEYFLKSYSELGVMKTDEKISGTLFLLALVGAFARPLYATLLPGLAPAYVFLILGCLSFFISLGKSGLMLTWERAQEGTMWGMMLLFGGGLALGKMVNGSGASAGIADVVSGMSLDGSLLTIIVFVVFATLISEATNSTVSAAVTVPIVLAFTAKLGLNAIPYWFITVMAYNCEFLLPISVRAIPISYGLDAGKMMKRGIPMMLIRILVVILVGVTLMKLWPGFSQLSNL